MSCRLFLRSLLAVVLLLCVAVSQGGVAAGPAFQAGVSTATAFDEDVREEAPGSYLAVSKLRVASSMSQNFEGAWPASGWQLFDISDTDGGEYLPGRRNCHPHAGANALWMVGGGAQGAALVCAANAPHNARSWAIYGPFDLTTATSATLTFYLYGVGSPASSESPTVYLFVGDSVNGSDYLGTRYWGDHTGGVDGNGYHRYTYDLSRRLGESQVWFAFEAVTDATSSYPANTIDDVSLNASGGSGGQSRVNLPVTVKNQRVAGATLRNSQGEAVSELDRSDALYTDFSGLTPKTQYDIEVLDPGQGQLTLSRFTTDAAGSIPTSALAYDLGLDLATTQGVSLQAIGTHTVIVRTLGGIEVRRWTIPVRQPTGPIIYAADSQGHAVNSFFVNSHSVYARGEYFTPGSQVLLFVVSDRWAWTPGTPFADVSGTAETATVGGDGKFLVKVWQSGPSVQACDLVADLDWNGIYSEGDVVDGYMPVGFMIQRAGAGAPVQVQLACDANRNYKDVFVTSENVYIYVNPPTQQFAHKFGHKYVVHHRDVWSDGDDLVDVTEGPERDHPQYGCTNEGRVLIWPATLTPGVYDVIFDINHNGVYDVGIDLLDNIDSFGNAVGGFFVPGAAGSPMVTITSPATGSSDSDGVIEVVGTVDSATPVTWARWYVNAGDQSNSGDLTVANGQFRQQVYLFPGQNTVQVWVRNAAGTGLASIVVNSAVSGVWDIHAQLTWNTQSVDEDLHLVRPAGSRNSAGDCYYSNCKSEDRSRNPDWGQTGNADDNPRLDIDCQGSCTGPENITLNTLDRAAANGRYVVEVYHYSGSTTANPKVNVWVRGRLYSFGPVATTNHRWWTVCYVDWPSGLVTPVGTIGSQPSAAPENAVDRFPSLSPKSN